MNSYYGVPLRAAPDRDDKVASVISCGQSRDVSLGASSASQRSVPRLCLCFVATLVVTALAASPPLSNKEIALMLRSGYTSDGVLGEITTRRVLDPLDPATKKSLLDLGGRPAN